LDEPQWNCVAETMQRRDVYFLEMDKPSDLSRIKQPYGIRCPQLRRILFFLPATANIFRRKTFLSAKQDVHTISDKGTWNQLFYVTNKRAQKCLI
jgi:hypothetical protein